MLFSFLQAFALKDSRDIKETLRSSSGSFQLFHLR